MQKKIPPERCASLFANWNKGMLAACLAGTMGAVYAGDEAAVPASAVAITGDFCFLAGVPDPALVRLAAKTDFAILAPRTPDWEPVIERELGARAQRIERYAFEASDVGFDRAVLAKMAAAVPAGIALRQIDAALFERCRAAEWSRDLVSQFPDADSYGKNGLGFAACVDGEPVSGASSYAWFAGGIEIEVDTRPDFRRRGLARACAARLMLECLSRGQFPYWDAHNAASAALAQQLGYRPAGAYIAYELCGMARD